MGEPRPFFTRVESLRGLGALAVAGWHMSGWAVHGVPLFPHVMPEYAGVWQRIVGWLAFVLLPGHAALMMFFVISGCVLRVSLQYGPQAWFAAARRFAIARVFRIYPIVIAGVLVAAWAAGWQIEAGADRPAVPVTPSALVANMLLFDASINTTLWALQLEVLMAPIIVACYFVERARGAAALIGVVLVTTGLSFSKSWAVWPPLSYHLFAFLLGMLIPTLGARIVAELPRAVAQRALVASAVLLILVGQVLGFYSQFSVVIESYAAAALISLVTYRDDLWGVAFLDAWPVRQLGQCSGSYYVLHMPLLPFFLPVATLLIPVWWSTTAPLAVGILVVAAALVALVPLMLVSYHLIEAPGIALGRRVIGWAFRAKEAAAAEGSREGSQEIRIG